jgi:transcription-repair coupling factor (superfamily II helicase)
VQVPIPRAGDGVAAPRIRDLELLQMVADLLVALDGKPQGSVDIISSPESTP